MRTDLGQIFDKGAMKDYADMTDWDLHELTVSMAAEIRRRGVPLRRDLGFSIDRIKDRLRKSVTSDELRFLEGWEASLEKVIDRWPGTDRWTNAVHCIMESIRGRCACSDIIIALYDGAGSFSLFTGPMSMGNRESVVYALLAQASVVSRFESGFAIDVDRPPSKVFAMPLYSESRDGKGTEFFHGVLILKFDAGKIPGAAIDTMCFFAHHLGRQMGIGYPSFYLPAAGGGALQKYVQLELMDGGARTARDMLCDDRIARPSRGLAPWIVYGRRKADGFPLYPDFEFRDVMERNIEWCHERQKGRKRNEAISAICDAARDILDAGECIYLEHAGRGRLKGNACGKLVCVGADVYERTAAMSAMIGAPYQTRDAGYEIIGLPQYARGEFIGSIIFTRGIDVPPPLRSVMRDVVFFCHHLFNILYSCGDGDISDGMYSSECPWHACVDTLSDVRQGEVRMLPPSMSKGYADIAGFGPLRQRSEASEAELGKISDWLIRLIGREKFPSGTMATAALELAGVVGREKAIEFYQASTTTIMDLCARAGNDEWKKTARSIFGEAPKFFGDVGLLMWLAVHSGGGRFDIYHSGEGDLDRIDRMMCEIFAQWTAVLDTFFFVSADDPNPIYELMRGRIGAASFVSIPIYGEEEPAETPGGFRKNYGPLVGTFVLAADPGRKRPTDEEWTKWRMFIPRIYRIMKAAREAGRLQFTDMGSDPRLRRHKTYLEPFKLWSR